MARIVGGDAQIATLEVPLDRVAERAVDQRGGAPVLRGEAGIGKSLSLEHTVEVRTPRRLVPSI